jgi:signal transduction histidine kinase/ActR/RegA family two-component response regulator
VDASASPDPDRVLVVAPTAADAALTRTILRDAGLACVVCAHFQALQAEMAAGAGAILLTDEVLASSDQRSLIDALNAQPAWSDIPIILVSEQGSESDAAVWSAAGVGSVTLLERPVRVMTLVSALRTAIRARRRQYQIRDQLDELKRTEASLRSQTERLELLWQAAAVLLGGDDPVVATRAVLDRIAPHFGIDAYLHYHAEGGGDALKLVAYAGVPVAEAQAITCVDAANDPIARLAAARGFRAYALCPLYAGGKVVGAVAFASRGRREFDAGQTEFLRTIAYYVGVAHERAQLVRELRDTDRRKDEFLATLAHELRNPLAPIRNALAIMRLSGDDAAAVEQAGNMMERQLGHMVRLIDDLLDVSRITRGKLELRKERVELAAIVRNALETVAPMIEAAGHQLVVSLPAEPIHLDADPVRLAQVLSNLLNNAAKYMDRGGHIALRAEHDGEGVAIVVRDSGIGIPPESLPSIFDMFVQVDRSIGRARGGLGIGLTLVKSLVDMHGGRVIARSDGVGTGAEFIVHLPIVQASVVQQPANEDRHEWTPLAYRILVADDNGDAAESMGAALRLMGNEVRTVRDGLAAVVEAEAFRPDVVLLDIGMPKLDGYEAAKRIRAARWGQAMVLIALTGWGQDEDRQKAADAGFDRHFTKPVSPFEIRELLAGLRGKASPLGQRARP